MAAGTYRDGKKIVNGRAYEPLVMKTNPSRSDPSKPPYQTIFWADGDASCNCRGWATHKHCRHVLDLLHEVETGYLGNGVRDIRRVAQLRRRAHQELTSIGDGVFQTREPKSRQSRRRPGASYVVSPDVAPAQAAPTSLDGDKIEYRRIRL
jgi:hypothetical protein